jgi:hypothetical protein
MQFVALTLNAQELRNSLYSGKFNELLIELAGYRLFDDIWGIPPYDDHYRKAENYISPVLAANDSFKRMRDCENVLRFFALREQGRIRGAMRTILDQRMRDYMTINNSTLKELKSAFTESIDTAHRIFGSKTFKIRTPEGHWRLSIPLYDGVMIATERLLDSKATLVKNKAKVASAFTKMFANDDQYEVITGKPNTADAVKKRLALIYKVMKRFA